MWTELNAYPIGINKHILYLVKHIVTGIRVYVVYTNGADIVTTTEAPSLVGMGVVSLQGADMEPAAVQYSAGRLKRWQFSSERPMRVGS